MSEPHFSSELDLETQKGLLRLQLWKNEIPDTSSMLIRASASGELAGCSFDKVTDDVVCLSSKLKYQDERHPRIRTSKRGTILVSPQGQLVFTRTANVSTTGTIVGRLTNEAVYVLEKIAQCHREGTRPIYPLKVLQGNATSNNVTEANRKSQPAKQRQIQLFDEDEYDNDHYNDDKRKSRQTTKRRHSKLLSRLLNFERRLSYTKWQ